MGVDRDGVQRSRNDNSGQRMLLLADQMYQLTLRLFTSVADVIDYTTYPKTTNCICNYENKRGRQPGLVPVAMLLIGRGRPKERPQFPGEALWVMTSLPVKRPYYGGYCATSGCAYAHQRGHVTFGHYRQPCRSCAMTQFVLLFQ